MVVHNTTPSTLRCPGCKVELIERLEVRGEMNFVEMVKEGKREGNWMGKKRPDCKMVQ